jgi:phosphoribosylpyrophosphate synthetase
VVAMCPHAPPTDGNLVELQIMILNCRRPSTMIITAVIGYFGYARADRKVRTVVAWGLLSFFLQHVSTVRPPYYCDG